MLKILGQNKLTGIVDISGSKNAALAIICASILSESPITLLNVPAIGDVCDLLGILSDCGAVLYHSSDKLVIDPRGLTADNLRIRGTASIRASAYLMGAFVGAFGKCCIPLPGGCRIGARPLDYHLEAFHKMGVTVTEEDGHVKLYGFPHAADIVLPFPSVGATVNVLLAACSDSADTTVSNAAKEPHIIDLCLFLESLGAEILGIGTDLLTIRGGRLAQTSPYFIMPDQIEAGTFMIYAALSQGDVTLRGAKTAHLTGIISALRAMGIAISETAGGLNVRYIDRCRSINIETAPYPGFPTDLQQPLMALLATATGVGTINENIFENRLGNAFELNKMSADIRLEGNRAIITGTGSLCGADVSAGDLRAAAALIGAALAAEGITTVSGISHVNRGYENIVGKLSNLGAKFIY